MAANRSYNPNKEHLEHHQKKTLENGNLQWRNIVSGNPLTLFLVHVVTMTTHTFQLSQMWTVNNRFKHQTTKKTAWQLACAPILHGLYWSTEYWVKHSDSMNQKQTYVLTKKSWTHTSAFTTFVCLLYLDYISCQEIRSSLYPLTCRVWAANWAWGNREAGRSVLHVSHRGVKCVCVCVCMCACAVMHAMCVF